MSRVINLNMEAASELNSSQFSHRGDDDDEEPEEDLVHLDLNLVSLNSYLQNIIKAVN